MMTVRTSTFVFGKVQKCCGEAALRALETGVSLLKQGVINGLVTAPVSKEALRLAGFEFPDRPSSWPHGSERSCTRCWHMRRGRGAGVRGSGVGGQALRIVFVTIHKPLAEVPKAITAKLVAEKIRLLHDFLRLREGIKQPKIAVLALNPHAYEFSLGEEARIARGIRLARRARVAGPFPPTRLSSCCRGLTVSSRCTMTRR